MKGYAVALLSLLCFTPKMARADEKSENFVRATGVFESEFNFVDSGNSRVFSSGGKYGSTYPTKTIFGPADRRRAFWQNRGTITFVTDYVKFSVAAETSGDDLNWPNSVGLRALLFAPLHLGRKEWDLGLSHHSAHNLVEERYGKGIETNGVYVRGTVIEDHGWTLSVWGNYNFQKRNESPFVFTANAHDMRKEDLEETLWNAGTGIRIREEKFSLAIPLEVYSANRGIASMRMRSEMLYRVQKDISFGPYAAHNLNVRESSKFGSDEWLLGGMMQAHF